MTFARLLTLFCFAVANLLVAADEAEWAPITPEDLAERPVAGESLRYLDFKVKVVGRDKITRLEEMRRVKIFTEEGIASLKDTQIFLLRRYDVDRVNARVIRQDGTIGAIPSRATIDWTTLEPSEVTLGHLFELEGILRVNDVVDLQWTTRSDNEVFAFLSNLPPFVSIRSFEFRVLDRNQHRVVYAHNAPTAKAENTKHESVIRLENIAPSDLVPFLPPAPSFAAIIGFSTARKASDEEAEWDDLASFNLSHFETDTLPGRATRELARELTAGAQTETEKVERLYRYCSEKLRNLNYTAIASEQVEAAGRRRARHRWTGQTGAETLEKGAGFRYEINLAFAALLRASGLKPRKVIYANSSRVVDPSLPGAWHWMSSSAILVSVEGKDRFACPGYPFLSFGTLPADEQGATALVVGKSASFIRLPAATPEENRTTRKAQLTLGEKGDLEGTVTFRFTGAQATRLRLQKTAATDGNLGRMMLQANAGTLPQAAISDPAWTNLGSTTDELQVTFRVKLPATQGEDGSLRVAPFLFDSGRPPVLDGKPRQVGFHFPDAYTEQTEVEITYPSAWTPAALPKPTEVGTRETPFHTVYQVTAQPENRRLVFRREIVVGREGRRDYPVEAYPAIRRFFEQTQKADDVVIKFTSSPGTP